MHYSKQSDLVNMKNSLYSENQKDSYCQHF